MPIERSGIKASALGTFPPVVVKFTRPWVLIQLLAQLKQSACSNLSAYASEHHADADEFSLGTNGIKHVVALCVRNGTSAGQTETAWRYPEAISGTMIATMPGKVLGKEYKHHLYR